MNSIMHYLSAMLPYALISVPVFIAFRCILYKKTKYFNLRREAAMFALCVFSVALASQTIIPRIEIIDGTIRIIGSAVSENNFIPFRSVPITYKEAFVNGNINYFIINFLGNIAVFVPFGFLIPLLFNIKKRYVILIGAAISFFIEFCQLFLPRNTDVDDIILNTVGTGAGLLIYVILSKAFSHTFEKFKKEKHRS